MKETRLVMGMPITIEICDFNADALIIEKAFSYFTRIDERFSTYKDGSEISRINRGEIREHDYSRDMKEVFSFAEKTKQETEGYFDIRTPDGYLDPSGIVKGLAIWQAGKILTEDGYKNFYIEAGGDIESRGHNSLGLPWRIGIKDPFDPTHIVKIIIPNGRGVATSGTYERGDHIYDPISKTQSGDGIVSITVIGANVYEADRFATAAFAMGSRGIVFMENTPNIEGYSIDVMGIATMTSGFEKYVLDK